MRLEDAQKVVIRPYITERTFEQIERENKLCFIVLDSASKTQIASAVEALYEVKVRAVNTTRTPDRKEGFCTADGGELRSRARDETGLGVTSWVNEFYREGRGKGGIQWRVPAKGKIAPVRYPNLRTEGEQKLLVKAILDERGRTAPLAQLEYGTGELRVHPGGQRARCGKPDCARAAVLPASTGNILPLQTDPRRDEDFEHRAQSRRRWEAGPGFRRFGGLFSKGNGKAILRLPSGKSILVDEKCRATVGEIAGGGRLEKPFMRAGPRHPRHAGRRQAVPEDERHRHGGRLPPVRRRKAPAPRQVHQHLEERSPGRKVGLIAPRKTGRKRLARASTEVDR